MKINENKRRSKSIKSKLLLGVLGVTILVFAICIGVFTYNAYTSSLNQAKSYTQSQADSYANDINNEITKVEIVPKTLALSFEGMKNGDQINRDQAIDILKKVLEDNPNIFDIWMIWEPDAFDGNDEAYKNQPGYDETGRLVPYVYKNGNSIVTEAIPNYTVEAENAYYQLPFKSGKEVVMEPYVSIIDNEPISMTTIAFPIKSGETVLGVVGVDIELSALKSLVSEITLYQTGYAELISNQGAILAHPTTDLVGSDAYASYDHAVIGDTVTKGETLIFEGSSDATDKNSVIAMAPISFGETGTPWSLMIVVPQNEITSTARNNIMVALVCTFIAIVLLAIAINKIAKSITNPIGQVNKMIQEMTKGHLSLRLNMETNDEIGEMAAAMDKMADTLQFTVINTMKDIAAGDVSYNIEITDSQDEITPALKQTVERIRELISETNRLSAAAVEGKLDIRGDANAFSGGFKDIVVGINNTLDAVIEPINMASNYMEKIGQGIIPERITKTYYGDFDSLKNSINACIDGLDGLVEANMILAKLGRNDFSDKIENDYQGIYGEMCAAINNIRRKLDHIENINNNIANGDLRDLDDLKSRGKHSEKDNLIPSFIRMLDNIKTLVDETEEMSKCAVQGNFEYRGDASQLPGQYAEVILGFNQTLDAIIEPLIEASQVLQELANGNLQVKVIGDYKGDHAKIKNDLNTTIVALDGYVNEIANTLASIGKGNIDHQITADYLGDFSAIKNALNEITTRLSATLSDINDVATQVEVGSRLISDGGQTLAQGTTEQASSTQELSASIDEVAAETKQNALRASEANERSVQVRKNAELGNSQMSKMVSAMQEINVSSNDISKIIKVIDDIAFQTNILALNAAVEAARAGEHGKGFAVVAQEVRNLAARSADAAKETTTLIEGSIEKVDVGGKIADETAESLKQILKEIDQVAALVGTIAQASNEQASEIAQITQGIEQIAQVVQTNSATAEESAAASEELTGQAEMLKQMVDSFQLKQQATTVNKPDLEMKRSAILSEIEPQIILDDLDKY